MIGTNPYLKTQVETASPLEQVILLYEKAVSLMRDALDAIEKQDVHRKVEAITKADRIIRYLNATLDMEKGGEVAKALREFYDTVLTALIIANGKNDKEVLRNAIMMLETVKEGWEGIKSKV